MMKRSRIAAVSYLNTIPFIYGIEHGRSDLCFELLLSPPKGCTEKMLDDRADIALVPVASIPYLKDVTIISDYCIGASDVVRTVVLLSYSPVEEIRKIYLDSHSLTSVMLLRTLCEEVWKIYPEWEELTDYDAVAPAPGVGYLMIGDKVFPQEGRFEYSYDLAHHWHKLTGLPMVFACWVAKKGVDIDSISALNQALSYGIDNIGGAIQEYGYGSTPYAYDYLTRNIDFLFDAQKKQALELFWDKGMKFAPRVNPG